MSANESTREAMQGVDFALLTDVLAIQGVPIAGLGCLPADFQYLPAGHHMFKAAPPRNAQNNTGWTAVHVHERTAKTLQAVFE